MDLRRLLLSPNGRLGRKDFWIASLLLAILTAVLQLFGVVGDLIGLLLNVCPIFLMIKRLHDIGQSGWWMALFFGLGVTAAVLGGVAESAGGEPLIFLLLVLAIISVALPLRAALKRGDPQENRYGPVEPSMLGRQAVRPGSAQT